MNEVLQKHKSATITSLEHIAKMKSETHAELNKSEEKLGDLWDEMFHQPSEEEMTSPTQKVISWAMSSAGLIDGALLGWKLYKRLGQGFRFFKKRKKK